MQQVDQVKGLRIIFDEQLTFTTDTNKLITSGNMMFGSARWYILDIRCCDFF